MTVQADRASTTGSSTAIAACAATARQKQKRKRRGVHWWTAISRALVALIGGYWVAWGCTAFLTLALPMSRVNRVTTASLLCFAVWTAAAMYAFGARSTWRAWWMLLLVGGVPYAIALASGDLAARP